jgi:hypothetical protein
MTELVLCIKDMKYCIKNMRWKPVRKTGRLMNRWDHINPLKTELLNNIHKSSSYLTGNILHIP